ncbi:MAG: cell division protein FtsL [Candidatus Riflebacteria bacterium]|nr:cell division protein FtsL [Candidatus Riflebacteria bacterium]
MSQFRSPSAVQEYLANRGKITLLFSGVVLTVSVMLFFYIWQYTKMVEIQIAIREVRKQRNLQNEQLEMMQVERAKLMAISRVDSLARERLGMIPPCRDNIQFLTTRGMVVAPKEKPPEPIPQAPPPAPNPRARGPRTPLPPARRPRTTNHSANNSSTIVCTSTDGRPQVPPSRRRSDYRPQPPPPNT